MAHSYDLIPGDPPLFGRRRIVQQLQARTSSRGITVLAGRPRMGKTRVLKETCRLAAAKADPASVGFITFTKTPADAMLLALNDLYGNWFAGAGWGGQARILYERHKGTIIEKAGTRIGSILGDVFNMVHETGGPVSRLFDKAFSGLREANKDLRTGGLDIKIPYDDALDLVRALTIVTEGRPIVLALDAWDQSKDPDTDFGPLKRLADELGSWPSGFHLVISVRDHEPEDRAFGLAKELSAGCPAAEVVKLDRWDLEDPADRAEVLHWIRTEVPAASSVKNETLIDYIDGAPAVLDWWRQKKPSNTDQLRKVARQAHQNRYAEIPKRIKEMAKTGDEAGPFKLLVRLASLPEFPSAESWNAIMPSVLNEAAADVVDQLASLGFLRIGPWPRFQHTTHYEAVRGEVFRMEDSPHRPFVVREVEQLAVDLAARITKIDAETEPFGSALAALANDEEVSACLSS